MKLHQIAPIWLVGLLLTASAGAQARPAAATLSHELLWSFQRVGAPVPRPTASGSSSACPSPRTIPQKDVTDLWVVPADGSAPPAPADVEQGVRERARMEPGQRAASRLPPGETTTKWARSTCWMWCAAEKRSASRLRRRLRARRSGVRTESGSCSRRAMWPGATDEETNRKAAQERKNAKSKARIYDAFPMRNWDHWIDESKTHLWVVDVDVAGDARRAQPLRPGAKVAALARLRRRRSRRDLDAGRAVGRLCCHGERRHRGAAANVVSHLWQVAAAAASRSV